MAIQIHPAMTEEDKRYFRALVSLSRRQHESGLASIQPTT